MIGHNNGPPLTDDVGGRARLYYWRKAHRAAWRTPPIEIVRLRARAAEQLGLSYKDYTSILLDRGRRPSAVFFALEGTLVRTRAGRVAFDTQVDVALMPGVERKLRSLGDCAAFVVAGDAGANVSIADCLARLGDRCGVAISDHAVRSPRLDAIRRLLAKHNLPPSQAVFVGSTAEDEQAAAQAGLARFLWAGTTSRTARRERLNPVARPVDMPL